MNCLVCHNVIRINRLQELFLWEEPKLCVICKSQLKPYTNRVLYQQNQWLDTVIRRLNQGDICLNQIFFRTLSSAIKKHASAVGEIVILQSSDPLRPPYPWLEILVSEIRESFPNLIFNGAGTLFIGEDDLIEHEFLVAISKKK